MGIGIKSIYKIYYPKRSIDENDYDSNGDIVLFNL